MQMISGWVRHLELTFKSKTGFGAGVVAWGLIALLAAAATVVFLIVAGFIALAERYGPLVAALALGGLFLLIAIVAVVCCLSSQRQTAAAARVALAARSQTPWLDPRYLGAGIQIGRSIGWRRLLPLAAVGVLAAGLAKEWIGRSRAPSEAGQAD